MNLKDLKENIDGIDLDMDRKDVIRCIIGEIDERIALLDGYHDEFQISALSELIDCYHDEFQISALSELILLKKKLEELL